MTSFKARPINLRSKERPVDIVETNWNSFSGCDSHYMMSNGAQFDFNRKLLCSDNPHFDTDRINTEVIYQYMRSCGYEWIYSGNQWKLKSQSGRPASSLDWDNYTRAVGSKVANCPTIFSSFDSETQPQTKEQTSMLSEFRAYLREHRDLVFTILIIAAVDAFFLDGALKSRLKAILNGFIDRAESKLNKDINGDGKVGA